MHVRLMFQHTLQLVRRAASARRSPRDDRAGREPGTTAGSRA
jgi:hypothetical protein